MALGKFRIEVNRDGQLQVIENFIDDTVILQLDRAESEKLAKDLLKVQKETR